MCGIAGKVDIRTPVILSVLKNATDAISHRGPDGEGHWINSTCKVGFGHRRLSIIDLSDFARQPMHYANGRYTITFNGEIYNYIELKENLLGKGYKFQSQSDTEVLLALYDLKKEKCLQDLDGMFAFAIWDEKEQTLFCARDRFGEKPFYYHHIPGNSFSFASEMKALWAMGIKREPDSDMVSNYIKTTVVYDHSDLSRTFFSNIRQLDGAHFLKLNSDLQISTNRYYSLDTVKVNKNISLADAADKFRELLTQSIKIRLRSDVPVGSSLSGGLDSSSIVMLIDKLKGDTVNQNTFSARFAGFAKDEGKYIHEVVKACRNITCHETWPTSEDMLEELKQVCYHQEEPFGTASIFAQWKVMQLAKQKGITVLLDGQGADESLAGYMLYYEYYLKQLLYTNNKRYNIEWSEYTQLRGANIRKEEFKETLRMKLGRMRRSILNQEIHYDGESLKNILKKHTLMGELKVLLRFADRNAMAHSREVRLPFLSHHLVDFIFSLPDNFILSKGWTKMVLREAMKGILPEDICWRVDKIGYEPPQKDWMTTNPEWVRQINESKERIKSVLDVTEANRIVNNSIYDWSMLMANIFFLK